jgi:DNA-binding Xre family transcriptional regulator
MDDAQTPSNDHRGRSGSTPKRARSESELRAAIVATLRASGLAIEEQVWCGTGAADIVLADRSVVIEVKYALSAKGIQQALGQVLLYRAAINPAARAIVVGYATAQTAALIPYAASLGVEVVGWNDESGLLNAENVTAVESTDHFPPSEFRTPLSLSWNVQALAQARGIATVAQLGRALGVSRQSLYGIWRGTAANVSLITLERLAKRLGLLSGLYLRPGDWFVWRHGQLAWNIKGIAEQVGLDSAGLNFCAGFYPQQGDLFWSGEAKFVFVDTLARLAAALTTAERPFDVGELFVQAEG